MMLMSDKLLIKRKKKCKGQLMCEELTYRITFNYTHISTCLGNHVLYLFMTVFKNGM